MGESYKCKCSNCKKKFEFIEGVGFFGNPFILMNINNENNLLSYYKNGINRKKLEDILKSQKYDLDNNYGYKTYQCPSCKNISNNFYFKLLKREHKEKFVSKYKCEKCQRTLKITNKIEKCPICGGEFDEESIEIVMWD